MARRNKSSRKGRRILSGFFYLVILAAVVAALVLVVKNNRSQRAARNAQQADLANTESGLDQELPTTRTPARNEEEKDQKKEKTAVTPTSAPSATPAVQPTSAADTELTGTPAPTVTPEVSPSVTPEVSVTVTPSVTPAVTGMAAAENPELKILVLNGTRIPGVAAYWKAQLETAGYKNVSVATYNQAVTPNTAVYGKTEDQVKAVQTLFPDSTYTQGTVTAGVEFDAATQAEAGGYDCYIVIGTKDARNK